jgi:hypothetical protein
MLFITVFFIGRAKRKSIVESFGRALVANKSSRCIKSKMYKVGLAVVENQSSKSSRNDNQRTRSGQLLEKPQATTIVLLSRTPVYLLCFLLLYHTCLSTINLVQAELCSLAVNPKYFGGT